MATHIRRRELIAALGGVVVAGPLAAHAQQPTMPVIGWLASGTSKGYAPFAAAFRQGLNGTGYVEGQNVAIEYRWAEGQNDRVRPCSSNSRFSPRTTRRNRPPQWPVLIAATLNPTS
jgi:hypothetical protein